MFFREEDEVEHWCQANHYEKGAILTLAQVWQLSQLWYGDRMAKDFRGRTLDSAIAIFERLNLTSQFWKV